MATGLYVITNCTPLDNNRTELKTISDQINFQNCNGYLKY